MCIRWENGEERRALRYTQKQLLTRTSLTAFLKREWMMTDTIPSASTDSALPPEQIVSENTETTENALVIAQNGAAVLLDSLSANEFAVEIDGERATGIFSISGFSPFKLDIKPSFTKAVQEPFRIGKAVQRDPALGFNRWLRETLAAQDDIDHPLRRLSILAVDDGVVIRRWDIDDAWISGVQYSDFDSAKSDLVTETFTIMYKTVRESWGEGAEDAQNENGNGHNGIEVARG